MSQGSANYIANDIFNPNVMKGIYDVIAPLYPDSLKIQEGFFPYEEYSTDEAISFFMHHYWGMTPPSALGVDPMSIGIPSGFYKQYAFGYWGEQSVFGNKDLLKVKNPEQPYKADGVTPNLWGEGMITQAIMHQKYRFNTLKEAFCGALISDGNFHFYGDGIDAYYPGPGSTNYILNPHYRLSVVSAGTVTYGGWTTGGTWATKASATPIHDLNQMILYIAQKLGLQVTEIWLSRKNAQYIIDADETAQWVERSPKLAEAMLTVESGLAALNKVVGSGEGLKWVIDDRTYPDRMIITSPTVASTSTSVIVDNDACLGSLTTPTLMFHKADGRERLLTATTVSSNTISFTASDLDLSMDPGDFIIYNKRFMAEDKIVFKTTRSDLQRFGSVPVQTSPEDSFTPGVHTYAQQITKMPNWKIVQGIFFQGGPVVFQNGGWLTLDTH